MGANAIHQWLRSNGDFEQGVALLHEHGHPDGALTFLLELGETSYSRQELTAALNTLHQAALRRTVAKPDRAARNLVTKADIEAARHELVRDPKGDGYEAAQLPDGLRAVRDELKQQMKEMDFLRHRLDTLPSDDDRLRDAMRIAVLDEQVVAAYARLDAWKVTGRDPGDDMPEPVSGEAALREMINIRSYLARHKSGQRLAPEQRVKYWKERLADLQKQRDAVPKQ
jgi:hypothetical protein